MKVPGRDGEDELYALATTLTDWQAYPAAELAACYRTGGPPRKP